MTFRENVGSIFGFSFSYFSLKIINIRVRKVEQVVPDAFWDQFTTNLASFWSNLNRNNVFLMRIKKNDSRLFFCSRNPLEIECMHVRYIDMNYAIHYIDARMDWNSGLANIQQKNVYFQITEYKFLIYLVNIE